MPDAAAAAVDETPLRPSPRWAFLACGEKGFAIALDCVTEIVAPQPLTRLPGCGREVAGLAGFRGRIITVFDLGVLAGQVAAVAAPEHRLVFVDRSGRWFGFAVDSLVTITAAEADATVAPIPGSLTSRDTTGTVMFEGRAFTALDIHHLLGRLLA
jgi:chemotaxis signal transduction protein